MSISNNNHFTFSSLSFSFELCEQDAFSSVIFKLPRDSTVVPRNLVMHRIPTQLNISHRLQPKPNSVFLNTITSRFQLAFRWLWSQQQSLDLTQWVFQVIFFLITTTFPVCLFLIRINSGFFIQPIFTIFYRLYSPTPCMPKYYLRSSIMADLASAWVTISYHKFQKNIMIQFPYKINHLLVLNIGG